MLLQLNYWDHEWYNTTPYDHVKLKVLKTDCSIRVYSLAHYSTNDECFIRVYWSLISSACLYLPYKRMTCQASKNTNFTIDPMGSPQVILFIVISDNELV